MWTASRRPWADWSCSLFSGDTATPSSSTPYRPGITILAQYVADFENTVHDVPSHDINVATAIKIGREMDPDSMPLQIKLVAMEIKDMATMSEELTPEVAERQESAERAVLHVLSEFRKDRDQISSD